MGCIYNQWGGNCSMFDPDIEMPGCDEHGNCICEDDEDPSYLCENYESDGSDNCEDVE